MKAVVSRGFFFWMLAGLFCVAIVPAIFLWQAERFDRAEPFYANPVAAGGKIISLRADTFGKGYFGASRNGGRTHKGVDISARLGCPILAAKSGRVSVSAWDKGYGEWVEIRHPDGLSTRYAHLQRRDVAPGDWVRQNQSIGLCGKTGNAADPRIHPHVHFELRFQSCALNPAEGLLNPAIQIINKL